MYRENSVQVQQYVSYKQKKLKKPYPQLQTSMAGV